MRFGGSNTLHLVTVLVVVLSVAGCSRSQVGRDTAALDAMQGPLIRLGDALLASDLDQARRSYAVLAKIWLAR